MNQAYRQPLTILGIPLKLLVFFIALLIPLLVIFERPAFDPIQMRIKPDSQLGPADVADPERHIVATPEMISKAMREIEATTFKELEADEHSSPNDRFFYLIELKNGTNFDAVEISIKPDTVSMITESGAKTTVARSDVQQVRRFKLSEPTKP